MDKAIDIYINLILIFFSGIIVTTILQLFNARNKKYNQIELVFSTFVNGMFLNIVIFKFVFKKSFINILYENLKINENEFFISIFFSIFMGILFVYIRENGILHLIAYKCNISFTSGFENILDMIMKDSDKDIKDLKKCFVNIKFLDGSVNYQGKIKAQETQANYIEILLENVQIDFPKNIFENKEYFQPAVYLQLIPGTFKIEFYESEEIENNNLIKSIIKYYFYFFIINIVYILLKFYLKKFF